MRWEGEARGKPRTVRLQPVKRRSAARRGPLIGMLAAAAAIAVGTVAVQPFGPTETVQPIDIARPQASDLFVADTGADGAPQMEFFGDWRFNVDDPLALRDFSTAVVSGKVIGVERSYVTGNANVVTAYSIQVETVYKGESIPEIISVTLPGGSVPLGEYISSLDKLDRYEMKLGRKTPEVLRNAGIDSSQEEDPRTMDPSTPVTENWGINPTREDTIAELQPDSWVFYLISDNNVYYGAGFDHALIYLKGGQVYSIHPEAERSPIPEDELFEK
jgi:hypothetical protein